MTDTAPIQSTTTRERLLDAAYRLFSTHGVGQVGVDAILTESGCAKSSLYHNFPSKEALALAFLDRREELWTREWLEAEVRRRASNPEGRLLAVFDVFDEWFRRPDFEGCSFIRLLLESESDSRVNQAAAEHLARIRRMIHGLARDAGLAEPKAFARTWHMLMKGSIIAAGEGDRRAARHAKRAARLVLDSWPRKS